MDIEKVLIGEMRNFKTAPFMFIGSGFSRRYIGLEDWKGLLENICNKYLRNFQYYYSTANSDLTVTASLMASDFHKLWWESEQFKEERANHNLVSEMRTPSSVLKHIISQYLQAKKVIEDDMIIQELMELRKISVDGIITTNWDEFLECVFPDYVVYIGQDDLINKYIQGIGEIYKIHGSVSEINSMVLTSEDYDSFNKKNAYLAAKLLSIIIEHPVFFLGYSISDTNIKEILTNISECISAEKLKLLEKSLYFVEPIFDDKEDSINSSFINLGSKIIPATVIRIKDYSKLYRALQSYNRKIPIKWIKQIEAQLYEIVRENDPKGRIALIDYADTTDVSEIDFVIGIGIKALHDRGLIGLKCKDIMEDIVMDNKNYNPVDIVRKALPNILVHEYYTPFNKYLRLGNFFTEKGDIVPELDNRIYKYRNKIKEDLYSNNVEDFIKSKKPFEYDYTLDKVDILRAKLYCEIKKGRINKKEIDLTRIQNLLKSQYDRVYSTMSVTEKSNYKKLVRIYDWLKYGNL